MKAGILTIFVSFIVLLAGAGPVHATTIAPLRFDEIARTSAIVVEGTVTDLQVLSTGTHLQEMKSKAGFAPASPYSEAPSAGTGTTGSLVTPMALPVEGGRMLFTEVTLTVDRTLVGDPGPTLTFRIAGGDDGQVKVRVFGMPSFEKGQRYVVFLRRGYEATAVPVVGVNQGYFKIAVDAGTGLETLLNADDDIVTGVEDGRVIVRRNPTRPGDRRPILGPSPSSGDRTATRFGASRSAERYGLSEEPPMTVDGFFSAVLAAREDRP